MKISASKNISKFSSECPGWILPPGLWPSRQHLQLVTETWAQRRSLCPACCSTSDPQFIFHLWTKCCSPLPKSSFQLEHRFSWHSSCLTSQPPVFQMSLPCGKHTGTCALPLLLSTCISFLSSIFIHFSTLPIPAWAVWLKSEPFLRVCLTAQSTQRELVPKTHFFLIWLFVFLPFQFGIFDREPCGTNCSLFTGKPEAAFQSFRSPEDPRRWWKVN